VNGERWAVNGERWAVNSVEVGEMSGLKHAESFRDLLVYQKARELQREVFLISQAFPKDEKVFSLRSDPSFLARLEPTSPKLGPSDVTKRIL